MMNFLSQNRTIIVLIALVFLIAINYNTVVFCLDSDFFGIIFSVILFIIGGRKTNFKINYFLIFLLILFEFVSYRLHTKSLHFLSLALFVCLIYYSFIRKFSFIAFICILLFSTIFNKFFEHLTTEIKQVLCYNVFLSLKYFITIDKIEGVNFYIKGAKISIDTACMGLSMFKTGLLTGALLLTLEEKKQQKYFGIFQILLFCFIIVLLNVISNYFRILLLVLMQCTKENVLHHAIGILCFIVYQVIPMLLIIRYFKPKILELQIANNKTNFLPIVISFCIVFMTTIEMKNEINFDILDNQSLNYPIKNGKWINKEVFKIEIKDKLIYIKTPSHKPLICWTGDGYKIIETKEIMVNNEKVWFNIMEKNNDKFYSYWWYECGNKKYISFIEVMLMKLIYNKSIRLINEIVKV